MAASSNGYWVLTVAWLCVCVVPVQAAPRSLTFQNMSGEAITAITISDKQNPDRVVMPPLAASLAADDIIDVSIEIPEDACLHDIAYVYGSGKTVIQENVDLCSTDALIIE